MARSSHHQRGEGFRIEGVAAQDAMAAEDPQISELAEQRAGRNHGYRVGRIVVGLGQILKRRDTQVDLGHLEASDRDIKIEAEQRKLLELLGEQSVVPGGDFGQPVIRDHKGAGLRGRQVIEA